MIQCSSWAFDTFSHRHETSIVVGVSMILVGLLAVRGTYRAHQVMVKHHSTVDLRIIHTVMIQGALTDCWHEACVALRHCRVVVELTRAVRVHRLIYSAIELEQILEDFASTQVLSGMWIHVLVNDFLTFVDEGLAHSEKLVSSQVVIPVGHGTWLILDAGHLEEVHSVGWNASTGQTIVINPNSACFQRGWPIFYTLDRQTV